MKILITIAVVLIISGTAYFLSENLAIRDLANRIKEKSFKNFEKSDFDSKKISGIKEEENTNKMDNNILRYLDGLLSQLKKDSGIEYKNIIKEGYQSLERSLISDFKGFTFSLDLKTGKALVLDLKNYDKEKQKKIVEKFLNSNFKKVGYSEKRKELFLSFQGGKEQKFFEY